MNQIYCIAYINQEGKLKRRHVDLDKIISMLEPDDTDPFLFFEITCQLQDSPLTFRTSAGPYYKNNLIEAFNKVLTAWLKWTVYKNETILKKVQPE